MAEYIKRDSIIGRAHKLAFGRILTDREVEVVEMVVNDVPAADVVEVRTGRWILNTVRDEWQQFHSDPECSECGFHPYYYHDHSVMKYCPNCGAKMDGGESDG